MIRRASAARELLLPFLLATLVAGGARAQASPAPGAVASRGDEPARHWPAPLDRRIAVRLRDVALRDALDRVAAAGALRLTWSAELLPGDRLVSLDAEAIAVGDALTSLLRGVGAELVVAGPDQVVVAPAPRSSGGEHDEAPPLRPHALDRVVVEGDADAVLHAHGASTIVLRGPELGLREAGSLAQAVDGAVPGIWAWEQSPTTVLGRFGSLRGASSFGATSPRIYVDGIAMANPLVASRIDPETIERIEVVRGPAAAARYGADAIDGVIEIVTRHAPPRPDEARLVMRATAGLSQSDFAALPAVNGRNSVALRAGTLARSASLGAELGWSGAYAPGSASRFLSATGGLRAVGSWGSVAGTARLFLQRAGTPVMALPASPGVHPHLSGGRDGPGGDSHPPRDGWMPGGDTTTARSLTAYTLGATAHVQPGDRWTHAFVAGLDGYRLGDGAVPGTGLASDPGAALAGADRLTIRATTALRTDASEATATFGADLEQSALRALLPEPNAPRGAPVATQWLGSTGIGTHADVVLHRALALGAGVRVERSGAPGAPARYDLLPSTAVAFTAGGDVRLGVHAAYGRGLRAARPGPARLDGPRLSWVVLAPETQTGIEVGADLRVRRGLALQLMRFDQRAGGLAQAGTDSTGAIVALPSIGGATNRGWELHGTARRGALALGADLALVDSRVTRLAPGYAGDLRVGDRMLYVPRRTIGATASWTALRWFASAGVTRATDWVGYDRAALATTGAGATGGALRDYWRVYPGATRLHATLSRDVGIGLALTVSGANLLGTQRGEPDDAAILPGRTIGMGLRKTF